MRVEMFDGKPTPAARIAAWLHRQVMTCPECGRTLSAGELPGGYCSDWCAAEWLAWTAY